MKRWTISTLLVILAITLTAGCEPASSDGSWPPDRDCEYMCGDDWLDPIQEEESQG